MTWGEIRTLIRLHLNDPTGKIWPDSELRSYIDDTLDDFASQSEANLKRVLIPLVAGTRVYDLPADCYEVRRVTINGMKAFGKTPVELEDLDSQYLTITGRSEWYYLEGLKQIAFYPVPTWTDSLTTFTQEYGVLIAWSVDGTAFTFDSEYGVIINAIDTDASVRYTIDQLEGVMIQTNDNALVAQVEYIYQAPDIPNDTDTPDMPIYCQYGMAYAILQKAFDRDGQGRNTVLRDFFGARAEEIRKEWYAKNISMSKGQDQFFSQEPVTWGSDLDWRMRVYP